MKTFYVLFVVCFVATVTSGTYIRGLLNPGPCEPGEINFGDCALEPICDTEISPKHFAPVPLCGCRCMGGHSRDLITGLCRPTNHVGQC